MKKIKRATASIALTLSIALIIHSCKEVGPYVNLSGNPTSITYIESPVQAAQYKNSLIEVFTGVTCSNCPRAHVALDNLISQYGTTNNHVFGVEYHVGGAYFSQDAAPATTTVGQNMTATDAQTIVFNLLGDPGFMPAGFIDRNYQASQSSIWDNYTNWSGDVGADLTTPTAQVNVYINNTFNSSLKQIGMWVSLHYVVPQTDSDRLTILLTEDTITATQEQPDGSFDTSYIQNHIMRKAVTSPSGDNIGVPTFVAGRVDSVYYSYTLTPADSLWKPQHMHIIAFVHKYEDGNINILQSQMVPVVH